MSTLVEPKESREVILFSVTEATVKPLAAKYMGLTIDGVDDKKGIAAVKAARSEVRTARTAIEKEREAAKREYLEAGRRVDAVAKQLTALLAPVEQHLIDELAAVDAELQRIEQAKLDKRLSERMAQLFPIGGIPQQVETTFTRELIRSMTDERFTDFLKEMTELNQRLAAEAKGAKEAADKLAAERAELDRLRAAETERQRIENERLAAERAEQQKEAARLEAERKNLADEIAAKAKAEEVERLAKEKAAHIEAQRIESERLAAEAEKTRLAMLPHKERLSAYRDDLLAVECPAMPTPIADQALKSLRQLISNHCDKIAASL